MFQRIAAILFATAFIAAFASCGGHKLSSAPVNGVIIPTGNAAAQPSVSIHDALAGLARMSAPAGVDAAVFAQVKDALRAALAAREGKLASDAPEGSANSVPDLTVTDNGDTTATLSWHYYNLGDYNQDGVVGIADITPIVMHYGEAVPPGDPNSLLAVIDGSGNGFVDIGDVTQIALHFDTNTAYYAIRKYSHYTANYVQFDAKPFEEGTCDGAGRVAFSYDMDIEPGSSYMVTPHDGAGVYGISSAGTPWIPNCEEWAEKWEDTSQGDAYDVVAGKGDYFFVVGSARIAKLDETNDDTLVVKYAQDGTVLWEKAWHNTDKDHANAAACGDNGSLYVLSPEGILLKYSSDGELLWQKQFSVDGAHELYATCITVGTDGRVYIGAYATLDDYYTYTITLRLDQDGKLDWAEQWSGCGNLGPDSIIANGEGNLFIAGLSWNVKAQSFDLVVLKYSEDGALAWSNLWEVGAGYGRALLAANDRGDIWVAVGEKSSLIKLNPDGTASSQLQLADAFTHNVKGFALDAEGNAFIASNSETGDGTDSAICLTKVNQEGLLDWSSTTVPDWPGDSCPFLMEFTQGSDGKPILIKGFSYDSYSWDHLDSAVLSSSFVTRSVSGILKHPTVTIENLNGSEVVIDGAGIGGASQNNFIVLKLAPYYIKCASR